MQEFNLKRFDREKRGKYVLAVIAHARPDLVTELQDTELLGSVLAALYNNDEAELRARQQST